jgi:hypothetical protein
MPYLDWLLRPGPIKFRKIFDDLSPTMSNVSSGQYSYLTSTVDAMFDDDEVNIITKELPRTQNYRLQVL